MRKKHAKTANDDKKPHKPKLKVTAKPAEKPKASLKSTSRSKSAKKLSPETKPATKLETGVKPYPEGKILRCVVHYTIYYIGPHKPTVKSEPFTEPCKLVFKNIITDLPLSVAAARQARAKIWDEWVKFRNQLEKHPPVNSPSKIDCIRINRTEYSAGKKGDAEITTRFIDEYVRSIPGYTDIPRDF